MSRDHDIQNPSTFISTIVLGTHLDVLTLVRLRKLLRTDRRLARIWANGVTIRSSP